MLAPLLAAFHGGRLTRRRIYAPGKRIRRAWLWVATDEASRCLLQAVFRGLSLDLFPRVAAAAVGRLWLCGHELLRDPEDQEIRASLSAYFPGAFSYSTDGESESDSKTRRLEALYYELSRSLRKDVAIFWRALCGRLESAFAGRSAE